MDKSYFVHGPSGCGKTRNAKKIAAALRLPWIVDDYKWGDKPSPHDTLHLTNQPPPGDCDSRRVMSYDDAMKLVVRLS
jgi:hypothetical protein